MFRNLLVTIPVTLLTALLGALYSDISEYISLLGGFCSVIIGFFFPGFLYVKSNDYPITHWKNVFTIIVCSIFCLIGIIAGVLSAITIIESFFKNIQMDGGSY